MPELTITMSNDTLTVTENTVGRVEFVCSEPEVTLELSADYAHGTVIRDADAAVPTLLIVPNELHEATVVNVVAMAGDDIYEFDLTVTCEADAELEAEPTTDEPVVTETDAEANATESEPEDAPIDEVTTESVDESAADAPAQDPEPTAPTPVEELVVPVVVPELVFSFNPPVSISMSLIQDTLAQYAAEMAPNQPVSVAQGSVNQVRLFRGIQSVLNQTTEFVAQMDELLDFIKHNRTGVFHEMYVYRFMDSVTLNTRDRRTFERVINLLLVASELNDRSLVSKQVNLALTLEGSKEDVIARVTAYFS